jgi:ribonucleoside-diphosphate reductase alpha subunit
MASAQEAEKGAEKIQNAEKEAELLAEQVAARSARSDLETQTLLRRGGGAEPLEFFIVKRNGRRESIRFDKITRRIQKCMDQRCERLGIHAIPRSSTVDAVVIAQRVVQGLYSGMSTAELDQYAAETAFYLSTTDYRYDDIAARIVVSNLHKTTHKDYLRVVQELWDNRHPKTGKHAPLVSAAYAGLVRHFAERIQERLDYERDFLFDYFGFRTLSRGYLLSLQPPQSHQQPQPQQPQQQQQQQQQKEQEKRIAERPQHMWMRVALSIHLSQCFSETDGKWLSEKYSSSELDRRLTLAFATYDLLSLKKATHATPTLFNAGTPCQQLSSCFLLNVKDDSIRGIYETLTTCALISKSAGGQGITVSNVRATHSAILGTNGTSNGLVPMLRVFNDTARYVDQGGGKRKGAFAIYLEPWHPDIFEFLQLRKNNGKEERRARDLNYALWIPDLFMRRVNDNLSWSLFSPDEAPGLQDAMGAEFDALYERYERERPDLVRQTVSAQTLWFDILQAQIESGEPYMLYKDACNRKSNQQNLGTIRCSNLCTEIVEYTSPEEIAVCNLASLSLPAFLSNRSSSWSSSSSSSSNEDPLLNKEKYDFEALEAATRLLVRNLNTIIDINSYPVPEARASNLKHRPVGLGVQGLANVFAHLRLPWESQEAAELNSDIFEHIYYAALDESCRIAEEQGHPYSSYAGSPISRGLLQFDMWRLEASSSFSFSSLTPGQEEDDPIMKRFCISEQRWGELRARIAKHGVANSLLVALMPTASTSQILGNDESFEPKTSNLYVRRVLAGEFIVLSRTLVQELRDRGLWSARLKDEIVARNGSVQGIPDVPADLQAVYKTVWEISQKRLVDMCAHRGRFVDQSQSFNAHMAPCNVAKLSAFHLYGWRRGLKTGMYYLRTRRAADPIKFTLQLPPASHDNPLGKQAEERATTFSTTSGATSSPFTAAASAAPPGKLAGTKRPFSTLPSDLNDLNDLNHEKEEVPPPASLPVVEVCRKRQKRDPLSTQQGGGAERAGEKEEEEECLVCSS